MQNQNFNLLLNGVPYLVKATPFEFNTERRFRVSYNGGDELIFAYDTDARQYRAIGDDAETVPSDVEVAIAERLNAITA